MWPLWPIPDFISRCDYTFLLSSHISQRIPLSFVLVFGKYFVSILALFFLRKSLRWDEWDGSLRLLSYTNWGSLHQESKLSKEIFFVFKYFFELGPAFQGQKLVCTCLLFLFEALEIDIDLFWGKPMQSSKRPCWASKCIAIVCQNIFLHCLNTSAAAPLCLDPIYPCIVWPHCTTHMSLGQNLISQKSDVMAEPVAEVISKNWL